MKRTEELLKLIAVMTGWSNSATVQVRYFQDRVTDDDNSFIKWGDWLYGVSASQCTTDKIDYNAAGKTLEEALEKLVDAIDMKLRDVADRQMERANTAREERRKFLDKEKPPIPNTSSPYRD